MRNSKKDSSLSTSDYSNVSNDDSTETQTKLTSTQFLEQYFNKNPQDKFKFKMLYFLHKIQSFKDSSASKFLSILLSISLRIICLISMLYSNVIIIHETDSWIPLFSLIFVFLIIIDLIRFLTVRKELTGMIPFLFYYTCSMIPPLWLQNEVVSSLLTKYENQNSPNLTIKYASEHAYNETRFLDWILFGTLLFVRALLPCKENWNLNSNLNLIIHDVTYIADSLDFSQILLRSRKNLNEVIYRNSLLYTMTFTIPYFSFTTVYEAPENSKEVKKPKTFLENIFHQIFNDRFIKFLIPCLFYEIPLIIARTFIFMGFASIGWDNFTFIFKNIIFLYVTIATYLEIKRNR